MYSNCDECGWDQGDEIIGEGQFDGDSVVYYEWKNVNGRVQSGRDHLCGRNCTSLKSNHHSIKTLHTR